MRWRRREKHRIECGDETLDRIKHDEIEREKQGLRVWMCRPKWKRAFFGGLFARLMTCVTGTL